MQTKLKGLAAVFSLVIGLLVVWEGYEEETYLDVVGVPTVCYGHTEKGLVVGEKFSNQACHELLIEDIKIAVKAFDRLVKVPVEDNVKAAFVSFIYNVGAENFRKSTALKLLNQGQIEAACHELPKWVYAKGKKLQGLVNRRNAEMQLCLGNV